MFILLKYISKLLKALASEDAPAQIAGGVILGMIIGLTPVMSLHNLAILILVIIIKVNIGMVLLSFMVFSGVAYLADPVFHDLGTWMLEKESWQAMWLSLYNKEIWALTKFYNTVVIGSFTAAVISSIVVFPLVIYLVKEYRVHINERIQKLKIVKALKGTKFYSIYQTVNRVRS